MGDSFSFTDSLNSFLNAVGNDPVSAMWWFFIHGGWIVFAYVIYLFWKNYSLAMRQVKFGAAREWVLLRITVPRNSEQTPRAIDNLFAHVAGMPTPFSWTESFIHGMTQSQVSFEIVSIEGQVSYCIYVERKFRDLIEASVYAQYPDADIEEVPDYVDRIPHHFPNETWDAFVTEITHVRPDPYPIRSYMEFVDNVSGEFKDPMAAFLENFSRLGSGEQAWYQIVITPCDQKDFQKRAQKEADKLKGKEEKHETGALAHLVDFPIQIAKELLSILFGPGLFAQEHKPEPKKNEAFPRMLAMSEVERKTLDAIEYKASKIVFMTKIRFAYVAKKEVMKKSRAVHPFIGALKQTNSNDRQSLKPDSKHVGNTNNFWWFKQERNDARRSKFMHAYKKRSNWAGLESFAMSTEELATLWHFPILQQVKAPQLLRTEAKKTDPPANIPFA